MDIQQNLTTLLLCKLIAKSYCHFRVLKVAFFFRVFNNVINQDLVLCVKCCGIDATK
jgi:hypothetical protein